MLVKVYNIARYQNAASVEYLSGSATSEEQVSIFFLINSLEHPLLPDLDFNMGSIDTRHGDGTSPLNMEPLAVVGMAFRGPQEATDTEKLWDFLLRARQAMAPFPPERINADAFWHPDPEHGGTVCVFRAKSTGSVPY